LRRRPPDRYNCRTTPGQWVSLAGRSLHQSPDDPETVLDETAAKALVRRYFDEVLDGGDRAVMAELFHDGAVQHFPGRDLKLDLSRSTTGGGSRTMKTTLHHLLADGNMVLAHLTHEVGYGPHTRFDTQLGRVDVSGRSVHWDAMALFRIEDGKIAEEWVNRDELSILSQLRLVEIKVAE
jgi:ketosteroid isomerase-like protein